MITFTDMAQVKVQRVRAKGFTRISTKNQATIPVEALREAGLRPGDEVRVLAEGPGRIVLATRAAILAKYAGTLRGVYPKGYLKKLRAEWRS